jgi:hypothetical protein
MKTKKEILALQQDVIDLYGQISALHEYIGKVMDRQLLYVDTLIDLEKTVLNILDNEEH